MPEGVKVETLRRMQFIHSLLSRGRYPKAETLAKSLNCSTKTVQRICRELECLTGAVIVYDRIGKGYTYKSVPKNIDELLQCIPIEAEELANFALATKAMDFLQLRKSADELCEWVQRASGVSVSQVRRELDNLVSFADLRPAHVLSADLRFLLKAVLERKGVRFRYSSLYRGQPVTSDREVDPYHLSYRESAWYMIGYDHDRKENRTFALGRMANLKRLDNEGFEDPKFDPKKHFRDAGIVQNCEPFTVHLIFDSEVANRLMEREYGFQFVDGWEGPRMEADKRLHLRFQHSFLPTLIPFVLGFGKFVEVREPQSLKDALRDHYESALKRLQ